VCVCVCVCVIVASNDQEVTRSDTVSQPLSPFLGFITEADFTGTRDYAPFWSIPTGIAFAHKAGGHARIRHECHSLVMAAARMLAAAWGTDLGQPEHMAGHMVTIRLPRAVCADWDGATRLRARLLQEFGIQVQ
jgi:isopenicillin-N epimerase